MPALSSSRTPSTRTVSNDSGTLAARPSDVALEGGESGALDRGPLDKEKAALDVDDDGVHFDDEGRAVVGLTGPHDPSSPLNLSRSQKWTIVVIISSCSFCVTCASSMIPLSYPGMEAEFAIGQEVATLGLSLFVIGLGWAPLVLSPLSEFMGRRPVYLAGFFLFLMFNFLVAFAPNTASFLIGRFLTGAAGSAFLSVAGGTVSDIFAPNQVGAPMFVPPLARR